MSLIVKESLAMRYRGFISYSKHDQNHAKRLHSALETYRVPKGIDVPVEQNRRLGRFFRDDDEMGASVDLGGALRDALSSETYRHLFTPRCPIEMGKRGDTTLQSSERADRIFGVIVDGTPNSDDPAQNCFPPTGRAGGKRRAYFRTTRRAARDRPAQGTVSTRAHPSGGRIAEDPVRWSMAA